MNRFDQIVLAAREKFLPIAQEEGFFGPFDDFDADDMADVEESRWQTLENVCKETFPEDLDALQLLSLLRHKPELIDEELDLDQSGTSLRDIIVERLIQAVYAELDAQFTPWPDQAPRPPTMG